MSYDAGTFRADLIAAAGEDPGLIDELRAIFTESATGSIELLSRARCDANWRIAAWRLQGLCASFGVTSMLTLAEEAANGAPGDPRVIRRLKTALAALNGQL